MSLIFNLSYFILLAFLGLESILYLGFVQKHFFVNPYILLFIYSLFFNIYFFVQFLSLKKILNSFNNILLPITTILYFLFYYLEKITYKNFIFTKTHINFQILLYLSIFSFVTFYLSKTPKDKFKKIFYLTSPLILTIFFLIEKIDRDFFIVMLQEDCVLEYFQFIFYGLTALFFYKSATKSTKIFKFIFIVLFIGSFFIAGEEISWGQRILGIETPESYKQINLQQETTLHNINFIQLNLLHNIYILIGFFGAFFYLFFNKVFPNSKYSLFIPNKFTYFGFFITFLFYFSHDYFLVPNELNFASIPIIRWQEAAETLLSISFFGHSLNIYRVIIQSKSKEKISQKIKLPKIKPLFATKMV